MDTQGNMYTGQGDSAPPKPVGSGSGSGSGANLVDTSVSSSATWSSQKINQELSGKAGRNELHAHSNKNALDLIVDEDGIPLYDGSQILTAEYYHDHVNQPVLDSLTSDAEGKLLYNGNPVQVVTGDVNISDTHIHQNAEILRDFSEVGGVLKYKGADIITSNISNNVNFYQPAGSPYLYPRIKR